MLEWLLGNTFPSVVFAAYGAFFFSFGATLTPAFAAFASYAPAGDDPAAGLTSQGFNASFGKPPPPENSRYTVRGETDRQQGGF